MLAALLTSVQVTVRKRFHHFTGTQVAPDQVPILGKLRERGLRTDVGDRRGRTARGGNPVVLVQHESPEQGVATFGITNFVPLVGNDEDVRIAPICHFESDSQLDVHPTLSGRVGTSGGRWRRNGRLRTPADREPESSNRFTYSVHHPSRRDARVWLRGSTSFGETDRRLPDGTEGEVVVRAVVSRKNL
jgi:hypothetical protein